MNQYDQVPQELTDLRQWVLWRKVVRDGKATKVPYCVNGSPASTTDPATWNTYAGVMCHPQDSIGFVFSKDDPYVGIDLDNCRNPETGEIEPWATKIIQDLQTYAEVSPSQTGVKLWAKGTLPTDQTGKKAKYQTGQVEMYQRGRYFAVTGQSLGCSEIRECQKELTSLWSRVFADKSPAATVSPSDDVREKILALPDAVAGDQGHDKTFRAACEILRHGIDGDDGRALLDDYNAAKCDPPWSKAELDHKWKSAHQHVLRGREFGILAPERKGFALRLMQWGEFQAADFPQRYLVPGLVIEGEHLIIGGRTKGLKTMVSLDLMISLASGQPFLGRFPVTSACPVAFLSGESGKPTLQRAAATMAKFRGAEINDDNFFIGFDLPRLSNKTHLEVIAKTIQEYGIKLFCIDPAYLATLSADNVANAGNQFAMGLVLEPYGHIGVETGCTMALVHHAKKTTRADAFKPMSRDDLTQSGFDAWMRQWILLSRRSAYRKGQQHELHMEAGGSAGHGGQWHVDVDEGDPLIGRRWVPNVVDLSDDSAGSTSPPDDVLDAAMAVIIAEGDKGISPSALRSKIMGGPDTVDEILNALQAANRVDVVSGFHAGRPSKKIFAKPDFDFLA